MANTCLLEDISGGGVQLIPGNNLTITDNRVPVNTTVVYECLAGYEFEQGELSRICESSGVLSGANPLCGQQDLYVHIRSYVAIGILLSIIALATVLLVDFSRHMKRKMRVLNHSQRHCDRGGNRPKAFIPTHKLKKTGFIQVPMDPPASSYTVVNVAKANSDEDNYGRNDNKTKYRDEFKGFKWR